MTQPTDATKLPEHIRAEEFQIYSVPTGSVDRADGYEYRAELCVKHFSPDDLRAIAAHMDAQDGRTAAPVVTDAVIEAFWQADGHDDRKTWPMGFERTRHALTAALAKLPRDATSGEDRS